MSPVLGRRQLEAASMDGDYGDDALSQGGGGDAADEETCAVLLARSNDLAQAEHKRKVRQAWREFEERVVATFGEEHDLPAGRAVRERGPHRRALRLERRARGRSAGRQERHLKALSRNRELEPLLRGRNPAAETRPNMLLPNDRFDLAAGWKDRFDLAAGSSPSGPWHSCSKHP